MISIDLPKAAAVPGTRSRREKALALIPPVSAWAAGSLPLAPHHRSLMYRLGGVERVGAVALGVVDVLLAWIAAGAILPMAALWLTSDIHQPRWWAGLGGLLLAWSVIELRGIREARRTP